jgi:hypothetical protein
MFCIGGKKLDLLLYVDPHTALEAIEFPFVEPHSLTPGAIVYDDWLEPAQVLLLQFGGTSRALHGFFPPYF